MNKSREKEIEKLHTSLVELNIKVREAADAIVSALEDLKSEEEDYYENMPESLQSSERGERSSAATTSLDEAISAIENDDLNLVAAAEALEEILNG